MLVLSRIQAAPLLAARAAGALTVTTTPDLGLTAAVATLTSGGVALPSGEHVSWPAIAAVYAAGARGPFGGTCFWVEGGDARPIQTYSERTGRACALVATTGAPTLLLAGFPMHRVRDVDPWRDTLRKLRAIAPVGGRVLDTCTGLGYTAIAAARTAERVVSVELDPAVLTVARANPWSQALFTEKNLTHIIGDAAEVVQRFDDASFSRVIHDPPTLSLAGDLYSGALYRHLWRVLKRGGRLFHYIGDLESGHGQGTAKGVTRRLIEAGFVRVRRRPEAHGLVAYK